MQVKELRLLIAAEDIAQKVQALGKEITATYTDAPLVVIGVLKGAGLFMADLVRAIDLPHVELDFIRISSYKDGDTPGLISLNKDVELSFEGKHVLIVEDIVDTGHSMTFLKEKFAQCGAISVRCAVLIDKYERRELPVISDFVGFRLTEGFVVGYGLDYAERYRHLPAIYEVIID